MIEFIHLKFFLIGLLSLFSVFVCASEVDKDFLSFSAKKDGSSVCLVKWNEPYEVKLRYSFDKSLWVEYEFDTLLLNNGDVVYFSARNGGNERFSKNVSNFYYFSFEGEVHGGGNIMSLLDSTCTRLDVPSNCFISLFGYNKPFEPTLYSAPVLPATTLGDSCYFEMFLNTHIATPPVLPAMEMQEMCYAEMFYGCEFLTVAPELPATTLAYACYKEMFSGCLALEECPQLPATELAPYCYNMMFDGNTSLIKAPTLLPATQLRPHCYRSMFYGCTQLTNAPILPALELADSCYYSMFNSCERLQKAPELPAVVLKNGCYANMFTNCSNLTYLKVHFTNWVFNDLGYDPLDSWTDDVGESGVFIATDSSLTDENIPNGWTFKVVPPCILTDTLDPMVDLENVMANFQKDSDYVPDILLKRHFVRNGNFGTICLPFSLNLAEQVTLNPQIVSLFSDMTIEQFVSDTIIRDTLFIITQTVTSDINKGTPYFIKWDNTRNDIDSFLVKNVTVDTSTHNIHGRYSSIVGTFSPIELTNEDNERYISLENLSDGSQDIDVIEQVKGFRAYLKLPSQQSHISAINVCHLEDLPEVTPKDDDKTFVHPLSKGENTAGVRKEIKAGQIVIYSRGYQYTPSGIVYSRPEQ